MSVGFPYRSGHDIFKLFRRPEFWWIWCLEPDLVANLMQPQLFVVISSEVNSETDGKLRYHHKKLWLYQVGD